MANRMTATQKKEALNNALKHFKFDDIYFIYSVNGGANTKFAIASKNETGGANTHTAFMSYDAMNGYLFGYNDAKFNKYQSKL